MKERGKHLTHPLYSALLRSRSRTLLPTGNESSVMAVAKFTLHSQRLLWAGCGCGCVSSFRVTGALPQRSTGKLRWREGWRQGRAAGGGGHWWLPLATKLKVVFGKGTALSTLPDGVCCRKPKALSSVFGRATWKARLDPTILQYERSHGKSRPRRRTTRARPRLGDKARALQWIRGTHNNER